MGHKNVMHPRHRRAQHVDSAAAVLPPMKVEGLALGGLAAGGVALRALAAGALAAGAAAIGALAVGALSIGRLRVGNASAKKFIVGRLEVDELVIGGRPISAADLGPVPGRL